MKKYFLLLVIVLGLLPLKVQAQRVDDAVRELQKLNRAFGHLYKGYVDSVQMSGIVEGAIRGMLEELDPHSAYLDAEEMKASEEAFEGGFSGIGVEYNILNDTLVVVSTIAQGPAEMVGVRAGDRIVTIDGESVVGIERVKVPAKLRGEKGTQVSIGVVRRHSSEPLRFTIIRDNIPLNTVDAAYLVAEGVGYIKVNRFGRTTMQEFEKAVKSLGELDALILDVSSNGGGLLDQAVEMSGYFLPEGSVVVTTEGRAVKPRPYMAKRGGEFSGKVVVMINESSASGSEIVAGAVQDWDRGIVVGRDSFGKGLVQSQIELGDGSALRLTIARYHTPSGRVIQRPYEMGHQSEYYAAHRSRSATEKGDTLVDKRSAYKTLLLGREVYSGGGIKPDVWVAADTVEVSDYMVNVLAQGVYNDFVLKFIDQHREELKAAYPTFDSFAEGFSFAEEHIQMLVDMATAKGVEYDEEGFALSRRMMQTQLSALVAARLFTQSEYYQYINPRINPTYKKAVEIVSRWDSIAPQILRK